MGALSIGHLMIIGFLFAFYFLPYLVANRRGHHNATAIAVANLFLGWTFIGWIICLIWACTKESSK